MFPLARFVEFTRRFEGYLLWFYLDVLGLVTIGFGNLADPLSLVRALVFVRPDGSQATTSEVQADWLRVKAAQHLRLAGGGAFEHLTSVRATEGSIAALVAAKVDRFEVDLKLLFPAWDEWPEECQMAAMSMCWAMGDAKLATEFPHWVAACRDEDWAEASRQCHMSEVGQNASFRARNAANAEMFARAGREAVTQPEIADATYESNGGTPLKPEG